MIIAGVILWTVALVLLTLWVGALGLKLYLDRYDYVGISKGSPNLATLSEEDEQKILEMSDDEFLEKYGNDFHDFKGGSYLVNPIVLGVIVLVELALFITGGVLIAAA